VVDSASATAVAAVSLGHVRRGRFVRWVAPLLVTVAGAAAYANSFRGEFVFDDNCDIVENTAIRHLWPIQNLLIAGAEGQTGLHSRPVVVVSFAFNYAVVRLNPLCYHITNLAIHLLAALLLFGIVRRTLLLPALLERFGRAATWLALSVSLLWAVHPLQTEAVAYVVQRYESLMGLFYFLALYAAIRCGTSTKPDRWAMLTVAATLFALGSKEVAVSLPIVILLYDRAFLAGSFREAWRRRWGMYLGLLAAWMVFFAWQYQVLNRAWAGYRLPVTWYAYAGSEPGVILHYLQLSFWPGSLCLDYGWPVANRAVEIVPPLLAIVGLLGATVYGLFRRPAWGFLGGWFFLILAPTSSVLPINDLAVEHRMYLSLAAVIAMVVIGGDLLLGGVLRFLKVPTPRRAILHGTIGAVLIAAATVALGARTWLRNEDYRTGVSIWEDTVRQRPSNSRAHNNLSVGLVACGQVDKAVTHYQKALKLKPDDAEAHNNLGNVLARRGQIDEAIVQYQKALTIKPDYALAHDNLGIVLARRGQIKVAIAQYQKALTIKPDDALAHNSLGAALVACGQVDRGIAEYQKALEIKPDDVEAHDNLGNALMRRGQVDEAIAQYQRALEIKPDYAEAHDNLGAALAGRGQVIEAIAQYQKALEIKPDYAEAHYNLGNAMAGRGEFPGAIAQYQKAVEIKPDYAEAHHNLGSALASQGQFDEAIAHYRRALEIKPDYVEARVNLDKALAGRKTDRSPGSP